MKKAQAAMEYLMTYGWAILIIIVVVAALYAMGVFKVGTTVSCSPCFSYFAYIDYASGAGPATGTLKIRNGANDIQNITVTSSPGTGATLSPPTATTATPGQDITINGITSSGQQTITVSYVAKNSGLTHTDSATIRQ